MGGELWNLWKNIVKLIIKDSTFTPFWFTKAVRVSCENSSPYSLKISFRQWLPTSNLVTLGPDPFFQSRESPFRACFFEFPKSWKFQIEFFCIFVHIFVWNVATIHTLLTEIHCYCFPLPFQTWNFDFLFKRKFFLLSIWLSMLHHRIKRDNAFLQQNTNLLRWRKKYERKGQRERRKNFLLKRKSKFQVWKGSGKQ